MVQKNKIDELINHESQKLKKKKPYLKRLEVIYEQTANGSFVSTLRAKTNKKVLTVKEENPCPKTTIRKLFTKISRLLSRKKDRKTRKIQFNLKEVS